MPLRSQVIGYEVFYSMTAVEDLGQWERKTVGLTTSIDLVNLERHAQVGYGSFKLSSESPSPSPKRKSSPKKKSKRVQDLDFAYSMVISTTL